MNKIDIPQECARQHDFYRDASSPPNVMTQSGLALCV